MREGSDGGFEGVERVRASKMREPHERDSGRERERDGELAIV